MTEEFNLSEKIEENSDDAMLDFDLADDEKYFLFTKDVKEFIKKEEELFWKFQHKIITLKTYLIEKDKLAGKSLT
jgi:hypothetical protein